MRPLIFTTILVSSLLWSCGEGDGDRNNWFRDEPNDWSKNPDYFTTLQELSQYFAQLEPKGFAEMSKGDFDNTPSSLSFINFGGQKTWFEFSYYSGSNAERNWPNRFYLASTHAWDEFETAHQVSVLFCHFNYENFYVSFRKYDSGRLVESYFSVYDLDQDRFDIAFDEVIGKKVSVENVQLNWYNQCDYSWSHDFGSSYYKCHFKETVKALLEIYVQQTLEVHGQ